MNYLDTDFLENESFSLPFFNLTDTFEASPDDSGRDILSCLFLLVICVIGLIGNTLVLCVVFKYAVMKTVTNIYILNMAVMDMLEALVIPFEVTDRLLGHWPFGSFLCTLMLTVRKNPFTCACFLTVMSADCCLSVYCPMVSNTWRKAWVVKLICATVWVFSVLFCLPVIMYAGVYFEICTIFYPYYVWALFYDVYSFALGYFIPLLLIGCCFFSIVIKGTSSARPVGTQSCCSPEGGRKALVLTLVFLICWSPFQIMIICQYFFSQPPYWLFIFQALATAKICANPIISGLLFSDFKESFRTILCF
ncbi:somatostatin receptor type 5-like [Rhinatrema bivittatum]|uniref:somatostatin receptor type 5-like n=1 Tax=Rhinatrema bivittatum TaxID=194408 RepID=UPI0011269F5B|nr:somatostatin receptor type 5-like [Rhinatrema bivittatum]